MAVPNDELFPSVPRVLFGKAPLVQVVCQLNFPRLLTIESEPPAKFQELVRSNFPLLERNFGFPLQNATVPAEIAQLLSAQGGGVYHFLREDRLETISLSSSSLSYTTNGYSEWADFKLNWGLALGALVRVYAPSFYTRVGLRYSNAINRESMGLSGRSWAELLNPELLDSLAFPTFESCVELVNHQIRMRLPDDSGSMLFQHGYGSATDRAGISYVIDFDFFKETKLGVDDVEQILDGFNRLSGRAFQWCLKPELYDALDPRPLA